MVINHLLTWMIVQVAPLPGFQWPLGLFLEGSRQKSGHLSWLHPGERATPKNTHQGRFFGWIQEVVFMYKMIVWNILKQKPTVATGCNRILTYQGVFILNGKSHWISYEKWRCFDWKLFPFENTKLDKTVSSTRTRKNTHPHTHTPTHQPYPPTSTSSAFFLTLHLDLLQW